MDPRNYFYNDSLWIQLQRYMKAHHERYGLAEDCSTEQIIHKLEELAEKNLGVAKGISKKYDKSGQLIEKEYDKTLFKKAIRHLNSGRIASFRRYDKNYSYDNLYLLCFVLGLNLAESTALLRDYLHENSLSSRSLKEFIILFGLEKGIRWTAVRRMLNKYDKEINHQSQAQNHASTGQTLLGQEQYLNDMEDMSDLDRFLSDAENLTFFSRLRNTHYLALLDYRVEVSTVSGKNNRYRLVEDHFDWKYETMAERYIHLFGLYPAITKDEEDVTPYLDIDEIEDLARIFGDTFLNYNQFCAVVQRRSVVEPCQEQFLLFVIESLDDEDYSSRESFINNCNSFLRTTGFPILDASYAFNRLVLDAYDETALHYPAVTKSRYLSVLRGALRDIIDYVHHPEHWN